MQNRGSCNEFLRIRYCILVWRLCNNQKYSIRDFLWRGRKEWDGCQFSSWPPSLSDRIYLFKRKCIKKWKEQISNTYNFLVTLQFLWNYMKEGYLNGSISTILRCSSQNKVIYDGLPILNNALAFFTNASVVRVLCKTSCNMGLSNTPSGTLVSSLDFRFVYLYTKNFPDSYLQLNEPRPVMINFNQRLIAVIIRLLIFFLAINAYSTHRRVVQKKYFLQK